jgi:hypothetical protein
MTAEAAFWNDLAERYSRQPLANPNAFERKIAVTQSRMKPAHVVLDEASPSSLRKSRASAVPAR